MGGVNRGDNTAPTQLNCKELSDNLNTLTPTIDKCVGGGSTKAVSSFQDSKGNIINLLGTSASSKVRGKSLNLLHYTMALGPQDADYEVRTNPKDGNMQKGQGLTLCDNAKNVFPCPCSPNPSSQRRSSHAEIAILFTLAGKKLFKPGSSLKLKIDWPNDKNYPCPRCARMLCIVANACHVDIVICNEENKEVRPFNDKKNCEALSKVCEDGKENMMRSAPYDKIVKAIRGISTR